MQITLNTPYAINSAYRLRPIEELVGPSVYLILQQVYEEGMTVRQLRRALHKRGVALSDSHAEKIGNYLAAPAAVTHCMFHDTIWWHGRVDFGDSKSCFINSRQHVVTGLLNRGARFVTWWRDDEPIGRSIVWDMRAVNDNYVGNGLWVFNTYSSADGDYDEANAAWSNRDAAYALAQLFGYEHVTRCYVETYYDDKRDERGLYINSNIAWSLTNRPQYDENWYWDGTLPTTIYKAAPVCIYCGRGLDAWDATCPHCHKVCPYAGALILPRQSDTSGASVPFVTVDRKGRFITERGRIEQVYASGNMFVARADGTYATIGLDRNGNWAQLFGNTPVTELTPMYVPQSRLVNSTEPLLFMYGLHEGLRRHGSVGYIQDDGSILVYLYSIGNRFHTLDKIGDHLYRSRETGQVLQLYCGSFCEAVLLAGTYVPFYWAELRQNRYYGEIYVPSPACPLPLKEQFKAFALAQGWDLEKL